MSPGDILNPDRSLTNRNRQKINAASVTRIDTIWIELKPNTTSFLTKIPILPQKHAAIMISIKSSFLISFVILFIMLTVCYPARKSFHQIPICTINTALLNYNKTAAEKSTAVEQNTNLFTYSISIYASKM